MTYIRWCHGSAYFVNMQQLTLAKLFLKLTLQFRILSRLTVNLLHPGKNAYKELKTDQSKLKALRNDINQRGFEPCSPFRYFAKVSYKSGEGPVARTMSVYRIVKGRLCD